MTVTMAAGGLIDLTGDRRRLRRERRVRIVFWLAGLSSLAISIAIVLSLLGNSIEFLNNTPLDKLWTFDKWAPRIG